MYFEKHVCNSRTTEPERSLWRPATSKSPQRCKVASPPPPAHCPRSTSRVVRIVRLQRHCCEVAIFARVPPPFKMYPARSGRRWSTATVDVHAAEAARTRRRSVQEGLSKRGGHSGVARSSVGGNGESTCAMCDAARWPVGRRRPLQNQLNWGTSKCATSRCSRAPQRKSTRCTRRCAPRSCATRLRRARAPQGDRHVRHMQNFRFSPINGQETAANGH